MGTSIYSFCMLFSMCFFACYIFLQKKTSSKASDIIEVKVLYALFASIRIERGYRII